MVDEYDDEQEHEEGHTFSPGSGEPGEPGEFDAAESAEGEPYESSRDSSGGWSDEVDAPFADESSAIGGREDAGGEPAGEAESGESLAERGAANLTVAGTLWLHYPSRDVRVPAEFSGFDALRVMRMFARARTEGLDDRVDPLVSNARSVWLALDIASEGAPLAITWVPVSAEPARRIAIDPLPTG
ncbi:hypothetical protein ER308_04505 [Egibacter rhizosphaerae]|uniref:Uncharacterized protein n=1 Tax=Egibacter rhizosphaerae TaxID=1670831 RepID=A0A411YCK6_9ACTN|nr:hypothetical protein [Egibacter rhizosphaerae]QBI18877.1 hypothetical protein ER308_04505 [Egibacter rhizosphaerae]